METLLWLQGRKYMLWTPVINVFHAPFPVFPCHELYGGGRISSQRKKSSGLKVRILCFQSIKVALHTLHHLRFLTSILHEIKNFSYLHGIGGHLGCELFWIKLWGRGGESLPKNKAVMFPSQAKSFLFGVRSFAWPGEGEGPMVELMVCCKCRGLDPGSERRSTHLGWT